MHAYLIEAHSKFEQLLLLLNTLDYPGNDIFIHIDKKSDIPDYILNYKPNNSMLVFMDERFDVQWGSYSQIKVEYELIKLAMQTKKYDRLHLISGVDFPIKSQKYIHSFFENYSDIEFVHLDPIQNNKEIFKRVSKYFIFIDKYGRSNKFLSFIQNVLIILQYFIGINRVKNIEMKFYKGSNWFSITGDFANYIISNIGFIDKTFKKTKCCDEVFLQTLLMNSQFKDKMYYSINENKYSCLRYIDWKRGNPYIFKETDFDELINSECLFARKFDIDVDKEILIKLNELRGDYYERKK